MLVRIIKKHLFCVMTSLCESFSMVLAESKGYGVPTVMYELPNLELTQGLRGIISVPQDDILALANGIILLFTDREKRIQMGKGCSKQFR